ncbi:MAG: YihY/virulence factor BrkB family protein [Pirellula sp.]
MNSESTSTPADQLSPEMDQSQVDRLQVDPMQAGGLESRDKPASTKSEAMEHGKRWLMDFFPNLRDAGLRWSEDDAGSLAASVAYYLALSLFPMFLLLFSGLGIFLRYTQFGFDIQQKILETVELKTSSEVRAQVDQVLDHLTSQSLVGGPTGLITAILAAIGVFAQIDRGFDKIFRIPTQKDASLFWTIVRVLRQRFSAFLMLLSLGGLLVVLFFISMGISQVRSVTSQKLPSVTQLFNAFDLITTIVVNAMLFMLIYRILPKRSVNWMDAFRGGLLAAIIWEVGRGLLGAVFIGMRYTSAYGAIGSFIALLLWCYYGISILFYGAEYVQVLETRRAESLAAQGGQNAANAVVLAAPTDSMRKEPRGETLGNEASESEKTKPRRVI